MCTVHVFVFAPLWPRSSGLILSTNWKHYSYTECYSSAHGQRLAIIYICNFSARLARFRTLVRCKPGNIGLQLCWRVNAFCILSRKQILHRFSFKMDSPISNCLKLGFISKNREVFWAKMAVFANSFSLLFVEENRYLLKPKENIHDNRIEIDVKIWQH